MGLIVHHKALGKVFEVQCMHIPIDDRTPFEGLVKFVSEKVRSEHALFPNRPIYLVGESFGGCLALSVAAFNPTIDLVVILANPGTPKLHILDSSNTRGVCPQHSKGTSHFVIFLSHYIAATSFSRSQLQPMFPFMEACPKELHKFLPHIFGLSLGNPIKMANVNVHSPFSPAKKLENLFHDVKVLVEGATLLADLLPKETLSWKFKLLKSGAAHANSHLHAVKSEVLVLASCMDCMLPSAGSRETLGLARELQSQVPFNHPV